VIVGSYEQVPSVRAKREPFLDLLAEDTRRTPLQSGVREARSEASTEGSTDLRSELIEFGFIASHMTLVGAVLVSWNS
jgi:hypothetical protein